MVHNITAVKTTSAHLKQITTSRLPLILKSFVVYMKMARHSKHSFITLVSYAEVLALEKRFSVNTYPVCYWGVIFISNTLSNVYLFCHTRVFKYLRHFVNNLENYTKFWDYLSTSNFNISFC